MTGSWTMDYFIYGCIIQMVVPIIACIIRYVNKNKGGNE